MCRYKYFDFTQRKLDFYDVNTKIEETSKTNATLIDKSFFRYQVSYASFEQEQYDARSDKLTFVTNIVHLKTLQRKNYQ